MQSFSLSFLRGGENEMSCSRTVKELETQIGEKVIEIFSNSAPPPPRPESLLAEVDEAE